MQNYAGDWYHIKDMDAVTVRELAVRIGEGAVPYLYCHQGCCEHALFVTDVRQHSPDDSPLQRSYPFVVTHVRTPMQGYLNAKLQSASFAGVQNCGRHAQLLSTIG